MTVKNMTKKQIQIFFERLRAGMTNRFRATKSMPRDSHQHIHACATRYCASGIGRRKQGRQQLQH